MPSDYPTLKNAPIIEGVLDIQTTPISADMLPLLHKLSMRMDGYATAAPLFTHSIEATVDTTRFNEPTFKQENNIVGYQVRNVANTRAAQVRLSGMNFSIFSPYSRFEDLESEARKIWSHYRITVGEPTVTRVGLRYINRLRLPIPFQDFNDYVTTIPEIADGVPQGLASFGMRLTIPDTKGRATANVIEWCQGETEENSLILFLDIDVFLSIENGINDDSLWNVIAELREYKNRIFFGSITPRLLETLK